MKKGFTLIELLIVIAILGVLAVVVLVAINPVQQLARTRDAGRISTVSQLGHAVQAYYTARGGEEDDYPTAATWADDLVDAGEIATVPAGVDYTAGTATECGENPYPATNPTWCYDVNTTDGWAIVYASLEADTNISRCDATASEVAYVLYSTADGRGGIVCIAGDVDPADVGGFTYQ